MPFTTDLDQSVGQMRLYIGDTVEDHGPRPDGRNFSDEELTFFLNTKGRITWGVAFAFEILQAEWSAAALLDRQGDSTIDARAVAGKYEALSGTWYKKVDVDDRGQTIGLQAISEYNRTNETDST